MTDRLYTEMNQKDLIGKLRINKNDRLFPLLVKKVS